MPVETPKLPVLATTRDVFAVTARHIGELFQFAWPWLLALIVISGAIYWSLYPIERQSMAENGTGSNTLWFTSLLASTVIGAMIAVPWHRRILIDEPQTLQSGLQFDSLKLSYAAKALQLMFAMAAPGMLMFSLMPPSEAEAEFSAQDAFWTIAIIAWLTALLLFMNRFSLALPGTAVGDPNAGFGESWRASKGNTWRLALVSFLATLLPLLLLFIALEHVMSGGMASVDASETTTRLSFTIANVFTEFVAMLIGMLYVTFLSLAYRHFAGAMGSRTVRADLP